MITGQIKSVLSLTQAELDLVGNSIAEYANKSESIETLELAKKVLEQIYDVRFNQI